MAASTLTKSERRRYFARGGAAELMRCRAREVVLSGPAGTGKTRAALEKVHLCALKYPGMRGLLMRRTHASLTSSALVTYREKVLHRLDRVHYYGGSAEEPPQYRYPNGSRLMLGGLDNAQKVMSSEYDVIYVNEATELVLEHWETLQTRARYGVMPYQQVLGDCNPDAPHHWLKQRAEADTLVLIESRHEENPRLWSQRRRTWTPFGAEYIGRLEALTGVRYLRLRLGIWAAAEGLVYDGWDRAVHLIERLPVAEGTTVDRAGVPLDWPRYLAIDFGYTNPFVAQWWAEDLDGRLYRYRELYQSRRLVEDHARLIKSFWEGEGAEPLPRDVVCDHDAEDRATLERHLGLATTAAHKAVSPGIQAVQARLRLAGDGKPRLSLVRDAGLQRDPELVARKLPASSEEEIEGYVWDTRAGRRRGEEPVKEHDHGMDTLRYLVAHRDLVGGVNVVELPW